MLNDLDTESFQFKKPVADSLLDDAILKNVPTKNRKPRLV